MKILLTRRFKRSTFDEPGYEYVCMAWIPAGFVHWIDTLRWSKICWYKKGI